MNDELATAAVLLPAAVLSVHHHGRAEATEAVLAAEAPCIQFNLEDNPNRRPAHKRRAEQACQAVMRGFGGFYPRVNEVQLTRVEDPTGFSLVRCE
jgi:hypothetical protein